jgi:hypothetical protein
MIFPPMDHDVRVEPFPFVPLRRWRSRVNIRRYSLSTPRQNVPHTCGMPAARPRHGAIAIQRVRDLRQ